MHAALAVAFGLIVVAPFFGRWRAGVWLRANMPAPQESSVVPEVA